MSNINCRLVAVIFITFWVIIFLLSGCISTDRAISNYKPTKVSQHLAFAQEKNLVSQAYRDALHNMGFSIIHDEDGWIEASEGTGNSSAHVAIRFSKSDTLQTDVKVTSEYISAARNYTHYPYQLSGRAATFLDPEYQDFPYIYPQLIYPDHKRSCSAPPIERGLDLEMPKLKESSEEFSQRLTYTTKAIEEKTEGQVYVETVIDENGEVTCAMIGTGLPNGLNENALAAVLRTEFEPARYRGEPVTMMFILPVMFRLQ